MKRKILFISVLFYIFLCGITNAQTLVFHEDFEVPDSMTSSGIPSWFQDVNYHTNGLTCIRDTVAIGVTAYLTSDTFSTVGKFNVLVTFDQICKINFADRGYVEVSTDNGANWTTITGSYYLGSSSSFVSSGYFSSFSYGGTGWSPANNTAIPLSSWWKTETFDISLIASDFPQVRIRFRLTDGNGNGNSDNYGWLIDNVNVQAGAHEVIPPRIAWSPPVLQGNIYYLGPFTVSDTITDFSGIDSSYLYYTVNSGSPIAVSMSNTSGNIWQGTIPTVNDGDTICYYVQAWDGWGNSTQLPSVNCISFVASSGITFPYVDNFDITTNLWTSSTVTGSSWQLGTPAFGVTTGTHSGANAWDVALTSGYLDNTDTRLTSPVFNFIGVYNAKLSFWRNHRSETGWDGTRLEYTTNGTTWQVLGTLGDPLATNWYTDASINSSNLPGWENNSAGWKLSTYKLSVLNNVAGPVQFRFVFTSDNTGNQDGFSIDDFSIILPSPFDVGVASILRPVLTAPVGISDTVKITVTNYGSLSVSNFNVSYTLNGGTPVIELHSATLLPGVSDTLTFATPYTVPTGSFSLCAFTELAGDGLTSNDTICKTSTGIPLVTIPYADNFDSPPSLWYDSSAAGTSWQLGTPNFGVTNSAHSPSNAWDINLTSAYGNNARSVLTSPLFDFTGILNAKLSFWQNRNIAVNDGLLLEYSINGGTSWNTLGTGPTDVNGTNWNTSANIFGSGKPGWDGNSGGWKKSIYLLPLTITGSNVQFGFVFTSSTVTVSDGVSIDDFSIQPGSPLDIGVTSFLQPAAVLAAGSSGTVQIGFKNFGTTTVTSSTIAYSINGVLTAAETWNGSLAPGSTTFFTFSTPFTVPTGSYDVCAFTLLASDGDAANDTLCKSFQGLPRVSIPYVENFDSPPSIWTDSSAAGTTWQLGTPNFGVTNSAHSPTKAWDINLTSAYAINARSVLTSPLIDFTGIVNAKLYFWQNRNIAIGDGMQLEYSLNGGTTWNTLGTGPTDANGTNWNTNANINASGKPGWDGNSGGWKKSTYLLPLTITGANVRFRFIFLSNATTNSDGVSIDDFSIQPGFPLDIGVTAFFQPTTTSAAGSQGFVTVAFKNYGTTTVTSSDFEYKVNGTLISTETWNGSLAPASTTFFAFATTFTVPPGYFNICANSALLSDGDNVNDTLCRNFQGIPRFALPYTDNFDTGAVAWRDSSATAGTNWQLGTPAYGQTTGTHSGSNCWDINLSTTYANNAKSYLISPLFDFTGMINAKLSFWQNRNSEATWDGTRLEYSINAGTTWSVLGTVSDPGAMNWYTDAAINSSNLPGWEGSSLTSGGTPGWQQSIYWTLPSIITGPSVMFRFVFTSDGSQTTDGISIDDFIIAPPESHDVGVTAILKPGFSATAGTTDSVRVVIYNFGADTTSNFDVGYSINSGSPVTQLYNGTIQAGTHDTLTFVTTYTIPSGTYNICSWTNAFNDSGHSNDTLCKTSQGVLKFNIPYTDNFDTGSVAWYDSSVGLGTNWQLGTPAFGKTTGSHSAPNCWDINLTSAYADNARSYLISPLFDFTGIAEARLSFWQNRFAENTYDGERLEYSIDVGSTWTVLGILNDPNGINWYNNGALTSSGLPAWDDSSLTALNVQGWIQSTYLALPSIILGQSNVMFRFVFTSDGSIKKDGVSIDDFFIYVPTVGVNYMSNATDLKIYPNPSTGIFYLKKDDWMTTDASVFVTDLLGKEVWQSSPGKSAFTLIDLSSQPNGIYFVHVVSDSKLVNQKIILCK